jgi:hypothetical protein
MVRLRTIEPQFLQCSAERIVPVLCALLQPVQRLVESKNEFLRITSCALLWLLKEDHLVIAKKGVQEGRVEVKAVNWPPVAVGYSKEEPK